jgi:hypothetical protein
VRSRDAALRVLVRGVLRRLSRMHAAASSPSTITAVPARRRANLLACMSGSPTSRAVARDARLLRLRLDRNGRASLVSSWLSPRGSSFFREHGIHLGQDVRMFAPHGGQRDYVLDALRKTC